MNAVLQYRKTLFGVLLCVATIFALDDLFTAAEYELLQDIWGDSSVYWTMGRGIMNGLLPYTDLFEIKPPGIFWISALSYAVGGDMRLGHVLSTFAICSLPLLFLLAVRGKEGRILVMAFLFGAVLSSFTSWNAAEFQVEAFGSWLGIAYAVLLERTRKKTWSPLHVILSFLFIGGAVVFKEPFLLSCAAVALLYADSLRMYWRIFLLPAGVALLLGTAIFAWIGYLEPYLTIYLAEMLGHHVSRYGSPIIRGFEVARLLAETMKFSSFFAALLVGLAVTLLIGKKTKETSIDRMGFIASLSALFVAACILFRQMVTGIVSPSPAFLMLLPLNYAVLLVAGIAFVIATGMLLRRMRAPSPPFRIAGALILVTIAAGSGGEFYNHHLVFAAPIFAALMLRWLSEEREVHDRLSLLVIALLLGTTFFHAERDNAVALQMQDTSLQRRTATEIDRILDACERDRYLHLGGITNTFGFTTHSPYGPLFWQRNDLLDDNHPEFQNSLREALRSSDIILYREDRLGHISEEVHAYLERDFQVEPPACAGNVPENLDGRILFRKH